MSDTIIDQFGIPRKLSHLRAVAHLEELKTKSGSNPWPVIEACLRVWEETNPSEWQSYLIELEDLKKTRKDPKFASTYDKVHGGYLRYTLDLPQKVVFMLRQLYDPDELPMNRQFFLEFARRFPKFKVAQKL